jgi:hypothetical protein
MTRYSSTGFLNRDCLRRTLFTAALAAAAAVTTLAVPRVASAHQGAGGNLGLGIGIGAPTGISLEVGAGWWSSFELALGLDVFESSGGYGHLVYKASVATLASGPTVRVPLYLGIGGYVYDHDRSINDNAELGLRVPIGINFDFQRSPLQLFAEIAIGIPLRDAHDEAYVRDPWVAGYAGFRLWF